MSVMKGLVVKEFREAFRDRRAIMAALFAIVTGPIIMAAVFMFQIEQELDVKDSYVEFVGAQHAPELITFLQANHVQSRQDMPENEIEKWSKQEITLSIPQDYVELMQQGKPVTLTLKADYSEKNLRTPLRRLESLIQGYSAKIGSTRLIMRGIDPRITTPITMDVQSTATPASKSGLIMGMVGMFIIMGLFTASMTAAIDTSAGERERHSLELILCQPVSTLKIVLSKVLCVSFYGAVAALLTMLAMTLTMSLLPLEKVGISIVVDPMTMVIITVMLLPLAFFAGIFQLFFAYRAKSFKEAQSYLSMILLLPMLVPMAIMFVPHKPEWLNYLPLAGQNILMGDLYKGESLDWMAFSMSGLSTLAISILMTMFLAKSLRSEKVVLALS